MFIKGLKKTICLLLVSTLCVMAALPVFAQDLPINEIDATVLEAMDKAKISSVSVVIVQGDDVSYLSYGYRDNAKTAKTDEATLYQIGSISKGFTALGILLLEDEGKLSIDDPVSKYIPWFTATYQGSEVKPADFKIENLLHQTSGFTNYEILYPSAKPDMTLEDFARSMSGRELSFYPSKGYAYANANYNLLGYIIEVVSGQTYADYMKERIFTPLGLDETYAVAQEATDTGLTAQGSRLTFFRSWPYTTRVSKGGIPAGYLYSTARDLGRWMQIQMGLAEVSPQFERLIEKSHVIGMPHGADDSTSYACGWYVTDSGEIYHAGGTPNYSSLVYMKKDSSTAVGVLTNINASADTADLCDNIFAVLEGKPTKPYRTDIWTTFDTIYSAITLMCLGLLAFLLIYIVRVILQYKKGLRTKQKFKMRWKLALACLPLVISVVMIIIIPGTFGGRWGDVLTWGPYSIPIGLASLFVVSILLLIAAVTGQTHSKISKSRKEDKYDNSKDAAGTT